MMTSRLTLTIRIAGLALVAALAMAGAPVRAEETAACPVVTAGHAVTDLSGQPLGVLSESVTPIDCDDKYSLVPWEDGVGIVERPDAPRRGVSLPSCTGGANDGLICRTGARVASKLQEWRARYGLHPRK